MKIKLAILEKDQSYLDRIVSAFNAKYTDKFEIYSFTNQAVAMGVLEESRIDVFIASDVFEININEIPKRCGFAYFVESMDIDTVNEQRAICKFQKADLIYKQILSIYSENAGSVSGLKLGDESTKVVAFSSPCGGVGTSTMAAAYAYRLAKQGKKALYLNLERFGSADIFFEAEGQFDLSDLIFSIKSKKSNLVMKLESCLKQDPSGVYFYSNTKIALDMLEFGTEDILLLLSELKLMGAFEYIILDIDFGMSKDMLKIYRQVHSLVWISDGNYSSNLKIQRAHKALGIIEANAEMPLMGRLCLIYNKFSNKTGKSVEGIELRMIGGSARFEHAEERKVIQELAEKTMFDKIV